MQLSEYRRNIKGYSFFKVMSLTIQSFNKTYSNKKVKPENITKHRYHQPVEKPPVIENLADYYYNRSYFQ